MAHQREVREPVNVVDVHSCNLAEDGATVCVWLVLSDGSTELFQFQPVAPLGEAKTVAVH